MSFAESMEGIGKAVDVAGVAAIVLGVIVATVLAARNIRTGQEWASTYRGYRQGIGKAILLGLELLVAGDIIRTVSVSPTLEDVAVLGLIVLIRTFLSFSLEMEIEGRLPWNRPRPQEISPGEAASGQGGGG
ncbi:MAG TPA: DUF1622 domain-containing protein [Tepidiformaceae bacterium]|nr:DUF1622 domain-containing protein [Tepidiformaceae bacterium]